MPTTQPVEILLLPIQEIPILLQPIPVVSLGTGGLVIVYPDTGITITSAYGNTVTDTTAVYNGQALTLGGSAQLAATVTNVVVVSPGLAGPTGPADAANAAGSGANNDGSVSTSSTRVVSLGAGGLVIVHPDTRVTITSACSNMVPTKAIYSGQTLSLGGLAVVLTNLVGVSPDAASQTSAANAAGSVSTTTQRSAYYYCLQWTNVGYRRPGCDKLTITNAADKSSSSANASTTSATTATTALGSGHTNVSCVSSNHTDTTGATHTTSSGNTSIATSTTAPDSSANKISGGVVGLLLALVASIWV
ncbi:hypothetical protein N7449_006475 [Penicillium cf. viridicatum]|uniref:Uncharacterized protein n=1 Tax=Penicillium cf. viridicatum TaxID=2972119 RepID=A0A9W9JH85_9EURO|nr:hypothetical protein N7449_006475 [Penicillium cf. viridicatum]